MLLAESGDDVSVVDNRPEAIEALGKSFDGTFHVGLVYDVAILEDAGVRDADAFLAVTDSDNANLMAVQVAKEVFGVPLAIARLDDPAREPAYRAMKIDFVAGSHLVAKVMVERIREPDFAYHVSFPAGDVQIVELVVGAGGAGVSVRVLEREADIRVAAVRRDNHVIVATDETAVEAGDVVVAAVRRGTETKLRHFVEGTDRP